MEHEGKSDEADDSEFFEGALEDVQRELGADAADAAGERLFERGFEKLAELGAGGSGLVWRARDRALDKEVALKVLDAPGLTRAKREQFLREARTLAALDHPNIVRIHSIDEEGGEIRIAMELVRGATLEDVVREHSPFSAAEAARVGLDLCRALAAIHGKGLLHGDVKHSNVMRAEGGRIVLLDFGLARGARAERDPAAHAVRGGTPLFMAPELFHGGNGDARSDLFSLGVLLYWLVSGQYPFELMPAGGPAPPGRPVPLRDRRADLPSEFVRIVERATAAAPAQRFASAGELEAELMAFLAREGGASRRTPPRARAVALGGVALLLGLLPFWRPWETFAGGEVRVRLIALRGGERVELCDLDPIQRGERMQLELCPEHDGYLYLLDEDLEGHVTVLFPERACELGNPLRAGEHYVLPGTCADRNPYYVYSIPSGGRDRLLLVESREPLPWIESEAVAAPSAARGVELAAAGGDRPRGIEIEGKTPGAPAGATSDAFPFLAYVQGRLQGAAELWQRELTTR